MDKVNFRFKNQNNDEVEYEMMSGLFPITMLESVEVFGIRGKLFVSEPPLVFEVPDISSSREKVKSILSTIVRLQVNPRMLDEVVEDFIDIEYSIV